MHRPNLLRLRVFYEKCKSTVCLFMFILAVTLLAVLATRIKVFLLVLFGWGAGRIVMQFKRWLVILLGAAIGFHVILVQAGLIEITLQVDHFKNIFLNIKIFVAGWGLIESLSLIIGLWVGVTGHSRSKGFVHAPLHD